LSEVTLSKVVTGFTRKQRSHQSTLVSGSILWNAICYHTHVCFYLSVWFIVREV